MIERDLKQKMVFIVGPRQVGKTWLAKEIAREYPRALYLNYDDTKHRAIIRDESWLADTSLIIFDEIHKMKGWKNYLKGVFDTKPEGMHILVTGSARLDAHRRMGDSLAGRFFTHHLMPLTLSELKGSAHEGDLERLLRRGGFPEPFLAEKDGDAVRWRNMYSETLLREDVLDFASVDNPLAMRQVFDLLRHRVGSPISASAIARDVGVSPITVRRYIAIFEALYMVFIVRPYTHKISRSILKEPKIYFYDHSLVESGSGAQFENFVATALLSRVFSVGDTTGASGHLAFLKTKDGKEVDFAMVNAKNELTQIVEAKVSDDTISPALRYFGDKYHIPAVQVVKDLRLERKDGLLIEVRKAEKFLAEHTQKKDS
jgi:predicted AAA+ superfamily ATPase